MEEESESIVKNIDGGLVFGGKLIAMNLFNKEYITVDAKRNYYDNGDKKTSS